MMPKKVALKPATDTLPPRCFDDEAKAVFIGIMERIEQTNDGSIDTCWLWPEKWPEEAWGPKPDGVWIGHKHKDGYGQFVLLKEPGKSKQKPLRAAKLAYQLYNVMLDPRRMADALAADPDLAESEWLGGQALDHDTKLQVRHDHGPRLCTSKACVNPFHLALGDARRNRLDRDSMDHSRRLPDRALEHAPAVLKLVEVGMWSPFEIAQRVKDVLPWHVVRLVDEMHGRGARRALLHDFGDGRARKLKAASK